MRHVDPVERRARAFASLAASSFAQKCIKNSRGSSFSMWLCRAVTSMPPARSACSTGFTSLASSTKSPVMAALSPPVGWKLMAIAEPIDGGTAMPVSVIFSPRGTPTWYTPPLMLPLAPRIWSSAAVSSSIGGVGLADASGAVNGVLLNASASCNDVARATGSPWPSTCM